MTHEERIKRLSCIVFKVAMQELNKQYTKELIARLENKLKGWNEDWYIGKKEGQVIKDTIEYVKHVNGYVNIYTLKHVLEAKSYEWKYINSMMSVVSDFNKNFNKEK